MTRVSQAELYDNRDVIKQIYDAKGAAETAEQAATDAASSATAAQSSADAAAREAVAAGDLAQSAADDAAKVNQFDSRIKSSVTHISTTGTADGVSIGYATDGKPSPLTVLDLPVLSGMGAGVVTPAQMQDISDQLDTLGRGQDAIKRDYLKRHDVVNEQDVTGRIAFKISPFVPTLKHNEYTDHDGTRAYNPASAANDPAIFHTVGNEKGRGTKEANAWVANFYQADSVLHDSDVQFVPIAVTDKNNDIIVGMFAGTYKNGESRGGFSVANTTDKGKQGSFLYITTQKDGTVTLSLVCPTIGKSKEIARLTPDP